MKNTMNKTRDVNQPYEIWLAPGWEWRVLKKYQRPDLEEKNEYARWFTAVKSPFLMGSYEMGDTYVKDIKEYATKIEGDLTDYIADNQW